MDRPRNPRLARLVVTVAVVVAALSVPAIASAHTGSIETQQDCTYGTRVVAHLDDNVAETATWELKINGDTKDSGTGPGPADLGPYVAGYGAGDAKLTIDYGQEKNEYTVSWGSTSPCDLEVHGGGVDPRAKITGPCGDPLYRWTLKAGSERAVFKIHVRLYGKGWRTFTRTVAGGSQTTSAYKHVLGGSMITISANGKVIKSKRSAPGGWYGPCPR